MSLAPGGTIASIAFLGEDQQTVYKISTITPRPEFFFSFHDGVFSTNSIRFVSPSPTPQPNQASYDYVVHFTTEGLKLDGLATVPCLFCSDVPTQFSHSNVVATLVSPAPQLESVGLNGGLLNFQFTGEPGYDYFVEFSAVLPALNWLSLTNFRVKLGTIHPLVTDSVTNAPSRFYRIRKLDCFCD